MEKIMRCLVFGLVVFSLTMATGCGSGPETATESDMEQMEEQTQEAMDETANPEDVQP